MVPIVQSLAVTPLRKPNAGRIAPSLVVPKRKRLNAVKMPKHWGKNVLAALSSQRLPCNTSLEPTLQAFFVEVSTNENEFGSTWESSPSFVGGDIEELIGSLK